LMRPIGCANHMLAYWDKSRTYSTLAIAPTNPNSPHTSGSAFVNGARMRVIFDTGAATSVLTLAAARRAGIDPAGPGVVASEYLGGIGARPVQTWIAPVASFKLGDEEVRNTRLRIGATASAHRAPRLSGFAIRACALAPPPIWTRTC
ncbi:MAG: aspartyl protease family protein, partial [Caulobacteraceae bacterium]